MALGASVGASVGDSVGDSVQVQSRPAEVALLSPQPSQIALVVGQSVSTPESSSIKLKSSTLLTSHPPMSWLKADANSNMSSMVVTELRCETRNVDREGCGKRDWFRVRCCFERGAVDQQSTETHPTSQPPMSWLKADAKTNMSYMSVTELRCETKNVDREGCGKRDWFRVRCALMVVLYKSDLT